MQQQQQQQQRGGDLPMIQVYVILALF